MRTLVMVCLCAMAVVVLVLSGAGAYALTDEGRWWLALPVAMLGTLSVGVTLGCALAISPAARRAARK